MRQDNVFFGELTRKEFNDAVAADMIEAAIVPTGALTVRCRDPPRDRPRGGD